MKRGLKASIEKRSERGINTLKVSQDANLERKYQ